MSGITHWAKSLWERSMLHRALLVAPPVAVGLLASYWTIGNRQALQYYTAKVEKGDIAQVVQATGTINAVTTVQVGSQVSGNIAQILADFNSHVKKGQVVAQIDPAIFRAQLQQARADLENAQANVVGLAAQIETQRANVLAAKANVDKMQAQLNDAKLQFTRAQDLFTQGIVAAAQRDTAQATYDAAVASLHQAQAQSEQAQAALKSTMAQLEQAKAQVSQRRAAAEMARVNLEHTTIVAPIDGTVIARNVDVGQTVAASLQAPTLFVIAQDLTKMLVYAKTDESDVGAIKVGATATFRVDSFPREVFRGVVKQVRMNATTIQNVVTYDTIIEFDNPDQKLFPGMTAYVSIPVAWENDVVKVPNGALRFKPEMSDDERKKLFAKYGIPEESRASAGGRLAAAGGNASGNTGGNASGARAFKAGSPAEGQRTSSRRDDWGLVWKLLPDKSLEPVRVRLGVTDFTFTAMEEGKLRPGDDLVIAQSSKNSQAQNSGQQRAPMGGPGGLPRRM
ncbi:MAG TPA: efflux RND transporter periplasmic adaptor subunit [Candidatus Acidoferrales bacterium]|nr:efflux RND transporter periplasmic adaptor subunit [Candidatus Acidoferrales bacterium]